MNYIDKAIKTQINKGSDVVYENMPYGTAEEVFSLRAIEMIAKYSIEPEKLIFNGFWKI